MKLQVQRVPEEGAWFEGEDPAELLGLEQDAYAAAHGPVRYRLFAQRAERELIVRGAVEADLRVACSRCAVFFSTTVTVSSFLRAYPLAGEDDVVDVSDDMREDVLLNMPHFPLCSEACRGLCPRCGADLNRQPCACKPPAETGEWSALDRLKPS